MCFFSSASHSLGLPLLPQVAGEPLDQTVVQYGPFVMTSKEDIQKTFIDYQYGRNGFEKAHVWKSEIGNM